MKISDKKLNLKEMPKGFDTQKLYESYVMQIAIFSGIPPRLIDPNLSGKKSKTTVNE